jgi:hypothetical protein
LRDGQLPSPCGDFVRREQAALGQGGDDCPHAWTDTDISRAVCMAAVETGGAPSARGSIRGKSVARLTRVKIRSVHADKDGDIENGVA